MNHRAVVVSQSASQRWSSGCWLWLVLLVSVLVSMAGPVAADCFYDGVSQTRLDHVMDQLGRRYDVAALTADNRYLAEPLRQPLGECGIHQFLELATQNTPWRYRIGDAGVVFLFDVEKLAENAKPVPPVPSTDSSDSELVVTGSRFSGAPSVSDRYGSNRLRESAWLDTGDMGANQSVTAALSRRAAVAFSQEAGSDRNISVRGLNSDLTRVSVNGMPMLATGTSIDARGAVNNSRSFDFNVLPQGLFNEISIVKSADARTAEGAIAGSVDLSTPRPFSHRALSEGANQQWLTLQRESNARNSSGGGALLAGFQGISDGGRRGWLAAVSLRQRTTEEKGYSTVRWHMADWGEQPALAADQQQTLADGVFSPRHNRYDILDRELTTLGVTNVLQWRDQPWGNLDVTLMASTHRQKMHEYHITSAGLRLQDLSDVTVNDFETDRQGMVYGDFSDVDVRTEHNYEEATTDLLQLSTEWSKPLSERWSINSRVGYQASLFESPQRTNVSLLAEDRDFSFDLRPNDRIAVNRYGFDINDPAEWSLRRISRRQDQVVNRFGVMRLETEFRQTPFLTHWFGAKWQRFSNDRQQADHTYESPSGDALGLTRSTPGNFARGFGQPGLPGRWVVGQTRLASALGLRHDDLQSDPTRQTRLVERSWAGWWQSSFEFWQLYWPVRGNIGLRYAATRQQVQGNSLQDDTGVTSSFRVNHGYGDWLPSLHLVAQPRDNLLLRLGYSREIARPGIDALTSPLLLRTSARIIDSGNIELEPSRAHSFDLGIEWYGEHQNLLAAGLFHTRIDSLIMEQGSRVTLDQLPYYNPAWETGSDADGLYEWRKPVNGPGTDITGLELNVQSPFVFLPRPWNRFGIDMSYALSQGLTRFPVADRTVTLPPPGLSRHVVNSALWYRGPQLEAGLTIRARSRYLTEVPGNNGNDREGVNATTIVGAYASWAWDDQLTLTLDANNLTNEPFDKFVDQSDRVYSYSVTGTEIQLGLRWLLGSSDR